ncbi:PLP-dependent aminotransferase family protein [Sulfurospirillum barnesii]|uniref:Transcriptional regulator with HTH domain and aminotransferase domain n=1 Tax=Sulfurospirillum barnesii (strain ATCC 700032 / DSM 10660 / SES-3) TaxID=760154 RepID=I3XYH3_SULBS|nr:PLP-dependent aminotransferase family protein [Sulfurospirillum barnesii]AFL68997.1 transcriptional regulator with HTH domain and aminotransferase domain [Sulfurospirillum barnesii SES-3]
MQTKFAKRVTTASRSFTRTILDLTAQNKIISFAGGLPDAALFPRDAIESHAKTLFETQDNRLFQYSNASGVEALKVEIAKKYLHTTSAQIMLTNGSQQGLDLVCKTFLDEKDCIVVEDPSYLAALGLFHMYNVTIKAAPLSSKGVDTEVLEVLFKEHSPKFFYTIPIFQNPTGYSYTLENRHEVARLAQKYNVILLEDSPYEALRYDGIQTTAFADLLPELTIALGTFSKTLAPDFRIGWMKAPQEIISALTLCKESTDLQNSKFFQHICAKMMQSGELEEHTKILIEYYRPKRDAMVDALHKYFGDSIEFVVPEGGMFIWVNFKKCADSMKLFDVAINKGVAFVPGSVFFADKRISTYGRLNYTNSSLEQIEEGVKALYTAYREIQGA